MTDGDPESNKIPISGHCFMPCSLVRQTMARWSVVRGFVVRLLTVFAGRQSGIWFPRMLYHAGYGAMMLGSWIGVRPASE